MSHGSIPIDPRFLKKDSTPELFAGFAALQSNVTYTPNQFFDVCLPYSSRGVVRLVGYMIYRTLGWSDNDGHPLQEKHSITYQELIDKAGISRGAIREVVDEAVRGNFIQVVSEGRSHAEGVVARTAVFELKWADGPYTTKPAEFHGFFEGDGNRTYIPNQFFLRVLNQEPLAVTKVVGTVIRFSIGFQAKRGFRRQQVALSYVDIERYSKLASRQVYEALQYSLETGYLRLVAQGVFSTQGPKQNLKGVYALKWADDSSTSDAIGSKRKASETAKDCAYRFKKEGEEIGSKRKVISVQKGMPDQFKMEGHLEIKLTNKTSKQQQDAAEAGLGLQEGEDAEAYRLLRNIGFDERAARALASRSADDIQKQVDWLERRTPARNRLGLLRRAIEEAWPEPVSLAVNALDDSSAAAVFSRHFYAGLAGNRLAPVAQASIADVTAAEPFLKQLLAVWPDSNNVAEWGERFGAEVKGRWTDRKFPVTVTTAIRYYGDLFLVQIKRMLDEHKAKVRIANREAHQARYAREYAQFVVSEIRRVEFEEPQLYQRFVAFREESRKGLMRMAKNDLNHPAMRGFDSEEAVLDAYQRFNPELLDFWAWDRTIRTQNQQEQVA